MSSVASASTLIAATAATSIAASSVAAPLASSAAGNVNLILRPSSTRGHANHGWLNSYHTFSFADWFDERYQGLHALRVINEDRVTGGEGFGKHPHREYEIFSYVCSGALKHNDSLGNVESLGRGSVQFTSAGTGLQHSEFNDSQKDLVHFIQMWVKPDTAGLKPSYATKHWSDEHKLNQLRLILSKDGRDGSIELHQNMDIYASILTPTPQGEVSFTVRPGREVYIHLIQDVTGFDSEANKTALVIRDAAGSKQIKLAGGDGALIQCHSLAATAGESDSATAPAQTFTIMGAGADGSNAEFILFDIAKQ